MTCAVLLAIPAIALADTLSISNDLTIGGNATKAPGDTGTANVWLQPTNGTPEGDTTGCNASTAAGQAVTVTLSSNNSAVTFPNGNTAQLTDCGTAFAKSISYKVANNAQAGSAVISGTASGGKDTGTRLYNTTDTLTVTITAPSNTAPSVSVGGVDDGASYNKGSVPNATCDVTDAEDGNSSFAATLSGITGTYASDGIGQQTASCSYTDGGGLKATASETYSIVDPSAPVITKVVTPASPDGSNGWYTSNVSVDWTVSDPESPNSLQTTDCGDLNITSDQGATTYTCKATSAGGTSSDFVTIKRDATDPTISGSASPEATSFGWNNGTVTVSYSCSDATSGVASCGSSDTLSSEGAGQSASGTATDNAGNTASTTVSNINIDLTNPTVALVGGPADGSSFYFGFGPDAPTCTASDTLSGLDGACQVSSYDTTVGTHTVTATANDKAANSATASSTYTVLGWTIKGFYAPVDMGIINDVKAGSTVPLKFEVFAGSTELTDTNVVKTFTQKIQCAAGVGDAIEEYATGSTSLRYDTTSGQFIFNWKTLKAPGSCYRVTMTTQDGSSIYADFRLK
jgi:hypothetical protein